MLKERVEILERGKSNGNKMVVRFRLPSGLEILGLPTENFYGGEWDLGPTWNYFVHTDEPFLVDAGRHGTGETLLKMMEVAGVSSGELKCVILSHGHEDHDGGLFEIVQATGAKVKAHWVYDRLIRFYPDLTPIDARADFPASCWHCFMPESFSSRHCIDYQRERNDLKVEGIGDGNRTLFKGVQTFHIPGHSPDSLAILLGDEVLIVGDTILPDISPIPTREGFFPQVEKILQPCCGEGAPLYGLATYIKSLRKLGKIARDYPNLLILPAHRLYYNDRWNEIEIAGRIAELIVHHVERCSDILDILKSGPKNAREIAVTHFNPDLLKGVGIMLAENEILSHMELLMAAGDVRPLDDAGFCSTGSTDFESHIDAIGG
jgi:glyoxylase-like metal-dependent hydrolase (beta-lactamase superfamily II)